ncbi:MAG TPA: nuclear transport factor 2 family protein [Trebonia sp.]
MTAPSAAEVFSQTVPAIQSGDVRALLRLCADDVVFEFPFAPPGWPGKVEGKRALGEYLAAIPAGVAFDKFDLETHQTVNPDVAVIEMTATGRVKDTSEPYEMSYVVVLTVRDGLIVRYRDYYWNPLRALAGS